MDRYTERAFALIREIVEMRRYLHAHAETGSYLPITTAYIEDKLTAMGCEFSQPCEGGVLADIGCGDGKSVLLRADTDALPHVEQSGESFASVTGASHSCGHDIHTASLLACAKILKENERELHGTVRLCFQPDEERMNGAIAMIAAGAMKGMDAAIGLHTNLPLPAGVFNVLSGTYLSSSDMFEIVVTGESSHGSAPENGIDPLYAAAKIVDAAQMISSREINALTPVIITFGSFNSGDAPNIIPSIARLSGTIRAFDPEARATAKRRLFEIARETASLCRANADLRFTSSTPCTFNDCALTADTVEWLALVAGRDRVFERNLMVKGSDDFAYYGECAPSVMFHVGMGMPADGFTYGLHNPHVRFDERALPYMAAAFAVVAREFLLKSTAD
ncbi:MAG: M20 family metallopeptidase [Oscillospiraceae bacterium]